MLRRLLIPLVALMATLTVLAGCSPRKPIRVEPGAEPAPPAVDLKREPDMRILLIRSVSAVKVTGRRGLQLRDSRGKLLASMKANRRYHFFQNPKKPGKLAVFEESRRDGRLGDPKWVFNFEKDFYLEGRGGGLALNGKPYAGRIRLLRGTSHFACINHIPMETYLKGVVPHEIGHLGGDAYEALKVQAVASRTYAVQRMSANAGLAWDMVDTIYDQVYRGADQWRLASRAVDETRGELVSLGGRAAEIYYSSTCGGHTTDISEVWNHAPAEHLRGIRDSDGQGRSWCRESRYFRWSHSWSAAELGRILRAYLPVQAGLPAGTKIGRLKDLNILEFTREGRVALLEVVTDRGRYQVRGDRVRSALKRDIQGKPLRSILFRLKKERDASGRLVRVTALGGGWGHGIGLCQVGAIARSRAGQSYEEILKAYFPGTRIRRFWR